MLPLILLGAVAAAGPGCSLGDYISVCNFTPARTSAFRIVSEARGAAKGAAPHVLTSEYVINGMHCRKSESWPSGPQVARADCVAQLNSGTYYHVVATTNAQNADHVGRVSIRITPTRDAPTLHAAPVDIRVKP